MLDSRWLKRGIGGFVCALGVLALASIGAAQEDADAQAKIDNAMSAAPLSISQDATILDYEVDADGNFVVLREGSNGWTCFPDDPNTPTDDPICADEVALQWFFALLTGEEPSNTVPGVGYMLQGGGSASNTDPLAVEPAEGENWMASPPHVMVFPPAGQDLSGFATDMTSGLPWIMWVNTPYQHIMVPVVDIPGMDQ